MADEQPQDTEAQDTEVQQEQVQPEAAPEAEKGTVVTLTAPFFLDSFSAGGVTVTRDGVALSDADLDTINEAAAAVGVSLTYEKE